MNDHLTILRAAVDGRLPSQIVKGNAEFSYEALRELHEAGLITGVLYDPLENVGNSILNPAITLAGRDRLAELEQAVPNHAAEPSGSVSNAPHHPAEISIKKIANGVITALLSAAAVWSIVHWWNLLAP